MQYNEISPNTKGIRFRGTLFEHGPTFPYHPITKLTISPPDALHCQRVYPVGCLIHKSLNKYILLHAGCR